MWGWPLYFAVDHPYEGVGERIDSRGELRPWRLAIDVVFCVLLVLYVRAMWVVLRHADRSPQPIAAALLSPLTVFLVVQLLLPLLDLGGVSSIREAILDASVGALLASAAAFAGLLFVGLPMTWVLRRMGRFKPKIVFGLGALLALFPVAGEITFDALTRPYYLGFLVFIAATGGLCGLTFWFFSGLAPSSTPA